MSPVGPPQYTYDGSSEVTPFSGKLSLREAVERALQYNLGLLGVSSAVRQARGQSKVARSALLPNLNAYLTEAVQQVNLRANGIRFNASSAAGFLVPTTVGPFNYFDLRATLSQTIVDITAWNNRHSAAESLRAKQNPAEWPRRGLDLLPDPRGKRY